MMLVTMMATSIGGQSVKVHAYPYGGTTSSETRVPISVYFTAPECQTIVHSGRTIAAIAAGTGAMASKVSKVEGFVISSFGSGIKNNIAIFVDATKRGTGVRISYTYVIPAYTNVGTYEDSSISYY